MKLLITLLFVVTSFSLFAQEDIFEPGNGDTDYDVSIKSSKQVRFRVGLDNRLYIEKRTSFYTGPFFSYNISESLTISGSVLFRSVQLPHPHVLLRDMVSKKSKSIAYMLGIEVKLFENLLLVAGAEYTNTFVNFDDKEKSDILRPYIGANYLVSIDNRFVIQPGFLWTPSASEYEGESMLEDFLITLKLAYNL